MDQTSNMEAGQDGEDAFQVGRCDLHDLETLRYHVLVRDHDLRLLGFAHLDETRWNLQPLASPSSPS